MVIDVAVALEAQAGEIRVSSPGERMRNRQVGLALFTLLAIGLEMAGARCFRMSLRDLLQAVLGSASAESTKETYLRGAELANLLVCVVAVAVNRRRIFLVAGPPIAMVGMGLAVFGSGQLVALGLAGVALGTACWKAGSAVRTTRGCFQSRWARWRPPGLPFRG